MRIKIGLDKENILPCEKTYWIGFGVDKILSIYFIRLGYILISIIPED